MRSTSRLVRLVLCIGGAACYGTVWWVLLAVLGAIQSFWAWDSYVPTTFFSPQVLLGVALFVGLATGIGAALSRSPSPIGRGLLRLGVPVAVIGLLAGVVSVLVANNDWAPAITFGALAFAGSVFAVAADAWAGAGASLRASLTGPLFGMVGGLAFGLGFALTFAAIYTNPCFPGHRYCLDPGRWYVLPMGLEAGMAAGLWLGMAACAALVAASLPRWSALGPETGAAG